MVPGIPNIKARKEYSAAQLEKRGSYYERFLFCILKSQTLRSSEFLVDFLRENQDHIFQEKSRTAILKEGPKKIDELQTLTGEADIEVAEESQKFREGLP